MCCHLLSCSHWFRQLVKTKKPTGDAHCPPEIKRAQLIDRLINEHVGTCDVGDDDICADADDVSDNSVELVDPPVAKVHTAAARRAPTPPLRRNPRVSAPELVNKLAKAFDPEAQQARDADRSQRSFQNTQLLAVNQQLRDAQATNESLRTQLMAAQTHAHDTERARDRAEMMLAMYERGLGGGKKRRSHARYVAEEYPDLEWAEGKIRSERIYGDGGACTQWYSDASAGDDSEKENRDPTSSSSWGHPSLPPSSPFDLYFSSSGSSQSRQHPSSSAAGPSSSAARTGFSTAGASSAAADTAGRAATPFPHSSYIGDAKDLI